MSLYHGGFAHVNAKYLKATRAMQVDDAVDDLPCLREALEHPGTNVQISTEEYDAIRQIFNDTDDYVVYNEQCYRLYVDPESVSAQLRYGSSVNVTDDDLEEHPSLREALQTGHSVHITANEYDQLRNLVAEHSVKWNGSYYVVSVAMA